MDYSNLSFLELHQHLGALKLEKDKLQLIVTSQRTTLYIGCYSLAGSKSRFDIISNDWDNPQFPNFPFNTKQEITILLEDAIKQYQTEMDLIQSKIDNYGR
jgi:hypothetical protein